ncbi:DoxX family protein [Planctomyces sp. SH-PL62]|uniref:DoxX family protein n=1 Tax=Planctomyces sp. SH-PL62 TaxID=1636152 RepID=UPI00078DE7A9|nr:DoxX family protein [Planctomyces sp. SH-PL62]AMV36092.1 Inner membrane protein YphA [Planctomyces sp. SH-PL62]
MHPTIQGLLSVAGRVALSTIFLLSAVGNKIPNYGAVTEYMASHGVPAPGLLLAPAILFLVAGSVSVVLGYKTRIGALLLFLFLVPTTYYFHDFWNLSGDAAQQQTIQFMKNLSMAGAMLFLIANGGGAWSLDGRRKAERVVAVEPAA